MENDSMHDMKQLMGFISQTMSFQAQPFLTPISGALSDNTARHVGSGGYVSFQNKRFLITNEHVAREVNSQSLARKYFDCPDYLLINNPWQCLEAPVDLACSSIDARWSTVIHSAMALPELRFCSRHAPAKGEFLFVLGFTGEKARYSPSFDMLFTTGTPYLTQKYDETLKIENTNQAIQHPDFDPTYHFAMHWNPEATTSTDGDLSSVPLDPHGMSGSLVWNTRFVEYQERGEEWSPGVARLTGILWGWDTGNRLLFATRIEHVLSFLEGLSARPT